MISEICNEVHNFFTDDSDKHFGEFKISGGSITLPFLKPGQYFRIMDSALNDGVYQYPASDLQDESFDGAVWAMKVPPAFVALCAEIDNFAKDKRNQPSATVSQSFKGYSKTVATNKEGAPLGWKEVFSARLSAWRKA